MAWGALLGAGANLLGSYLGGQQSGSYTPQYLSGDKVRDQLLHGTEDQRTNLGGLFDRSSGLGGNLATGAGRAMDRGFGFLDQAGGLLEGTSPILQAMRQQQTQQLGDVGAQQGIQTNRLLASRGMGLGAMRHALGQDRVSQLGEQARQGLLGIQQYGLKAGQGFGQLGGQMFGQAAGLGQAASGAYAGARGTQQDILSLQTGANTAAANQMAANFEAQQRAAAQEGAQNQAFGQGIGGMVGQGLSAYMGWG